jgi:hypothetical protein
VYDNRDERLCTFTGSTVRLFASGSSNHKDRAIERKD